jgi:chemotaxis protein MotB
VPIPKKQKKCEEGAPAWLLSWGDLTTLLLTFFVMMYDTGSIDQVELNLVLSAFQGLGSPAATPCRQASSRSWATRS